MALQHLRSSTAHKRPIPTVMSAGQIAINTNEASPGLFFKDSNGDLVKVGPVHIGTTAPNSSPASVAATALVTGTVYQILTVGTSDFTLVGASANTVGTIFTATGTTTGTGTVSGQQGVEKGEQWLDNSGGTYVLKIYDGTDWRSESGTFVDVSGDTMTGDLVMNNANIVFEGATADDFETTLTVTDPTADRTITLPNVTGTVVTTGDTGTVTSTMIADGTIVNADINASAAIAPSKIGSGALPSGVTVASTNIVDGTIVNADVNASAAIAGTKIDPDFGSQTIETTGVINAGSGTAAAPSVSVGTTDNGIYSPGTDQLAISTNGTQRINIEADGDINIDSGGVFYDATNNRLAIGTTSPSQLLELNSTNASGGVGLNITNLGDGGTTTVPYAFINARLNAVRNAGEIRFGRESNYGSAANADSFMAFYTAADDVNNERARIDSSGRLLVGTSSAFGIKNELLHIASPSAGSIALLRDDTSIGPGNELGGIRWYSNATTASTYQVCAQVRAVAEDTFADGDKPTRLEFSTTADGASSPTERMRISNGGFVGINNTNPSNYLAIVGDGATANIRSRQSPTSSVAHLVFNNNNGDVGTIATSGSSTAYNTSSDYRLKENITSVTDGIIRLQQLKPSRFNFISDPTKTVDGFIAHEAQAVVPECVTGEKDAVDENGDPVYQGIDQSKLVPLLTAALQEAVAKIESLEARLTAAGI